MTKPLKAKDRQIGGNFYKKTIQPWDIIETWGLDFWRGNVIKYILRAPEKNGVEDLKKAKHYLDYLIEKTEGKKKKWGG